VVESDDNRVVFDDEFVNDDGGLDAERADDNGLVIDDEVAVDNGIVVDDEV
jgi:hypothetical protein